MHFNILFTHNNIEYALEIFSINIYDKEGKDYLKLLYKEESLPKSTMSYGAYIEDIKSISDLKQKIIDKFLKSYETLKNIEKVIDL